MQIISPLLEGSKHPLLWDLVRHIRLLSRAQLNLTFRVLIESLDTRRVKILRRVLEHLSMQWVFLRLLKPKLANCLLFVQVLHFLLWHGLVQCLLRRNTLTALCALINLRGARDFLEVAERRELSIGWSVHWANAGSILHKPLALLTGIELRGFDKTCRFRAVIVGSVVKRRAHRVFFHVEIWLQICRLNWALFALLCCEHHVCA